MRTQSFSLPARRADYNRIAMLRFASVLHPGEPSAEVR